ncbi:hypothetical protein [Chlamydia gallinacea]|nr:hypothetical protein [Chlamydia gallinacea]MBX6687132.1 hypothetical protein [Chlamydia gallinacea]
MSAKAPQRVLGTKAPTRSGLGLYPVCFQANVAELSVCDAPLDQVTVQFP